MGPPLRYNCNTKLLKGFIFSITFWEHWCTPILNMTGFSCTCMKRKHICKSRESNLSILLSKKVPYPFSQSLSGTKVTLERCETLKAPPCFSTFKCQQAATLDGSVGSPKNLLLAKNSCAKNGSQQLSQFTT